MGSVERSARILKLLSTQDKPLNLSSISSELDIPMSTAHGIVATLLQEHLVEVDQSLHYSIGLGALEIGAAYLRRNGVASVVMPELVRLTLNLGMTSHWAVLDGPDVVYLCKEDPPGVGIKLASAVGARLSASTTAVGKCCLAWLPEEQLAAYVEGGDRDLAAELRRVREAGCAIDQGVTATGITCVAAPVLGLTGPRGAIGVSFLTGEAEPEAVAESVVAASQVLNRALGATNGSDIHGDVN